MKLTRLTRKEGGGRAVVDAALVARQGDVAYGEAIERLSRMEDAYAYLCYEREAAEKELERMKKDGEQGSERYRELAARKLVQGTVLAMMEK